jgi:hypothetical protein
VKVKERIEILDVDKKIVDILKENNINIIEELWILKRKDLKLLGLNDREINQVIIKLELLGLGLNKKTYKSNIR